MDFLNWKCAFLLTIKKVWKKFTKQICKEITIIIFQTCWKYQIGLRQNSKFLLQPYFTDPLIKEGGLYWPENGNDPSPPGRPRKWWSECDHPTFSGSEGRKEIWKRSSSSLKKKERNLLWHDDERKKVKRHQQKKKKIIALYRGLNDRGNDLLL